MESLNRIARGKRKENIPPPYDSYLIPEQRDIQKNVNIQKNVSVNLYPSPGSHVGVFHHPNGSTKPGPKHMGATIEGMPRIVSLRSGTEKSQQSSLVQTNLSCPYWPPRETTGDPVRPKQSNLSSKLQRFGLENKVDIGKPPRVCSLGSSHLGLKRSSSKNLLPRSHDVPSARDATSKDRMGSKDQEASKQPLGRFSDQKCNRNLEAHGDAFSCRWLETPSQGSLRRNSCPSDTRLNSSAGPTSPGPALTLDHLKTSDLVEDHPSSATLQAVLQSSQRSADLRSSIQRLQEEIEMGALGSFPWESKYPSLPRPSGVAPAAPLSITDWLAVEQNYTNQAGGQWSTSFGRDWGGLGPPLAALGDEELLPFISGSNPPGVFPSATETLDYRWPKGFYRRVSPTSLLVPRKGASFSSLKPHSGGQLEEAFSCGWPEMDYRQRTHGPEEPSPSRASHCSELGPKDLPLGLLSAGSLEVSSETLPVKSLGNKSLRDTRREEHLTAWSSGGPEVILTHWSGSTDLHAHKPGESGGTSFMTDECGTFSPRWKLGVSGAAVLEKSLRECSQASDGTHIVDLTTLVAESSRDYPTSICNSDWPAVGSAWREESPMEKGKEKMEPLCFERRDFGTDARPKEDLEKDNVSTDKKRNRTLPVKRDPLLAKSFLAWRDYVFEKEAAARAVYERQLKHKGLAALRWAVELRNDQAGTAQRSHALAVLAASFRRWQGAAAKQREERTSRRQEPTIRGRGLRPSALRSTPLAQGAILSQLSSEHQEEAAQYSRAEGNVWLELCRVQGTDELCRKAKALRDVRRMAAFRLWRLQKERLEREGICAQEARTLLEKRKMASAFQVWRSRSKASQETWRLADRVQKGLISRCFDAWKCFARREAVSRQGLERLRVRSMRLCFRQWSRMVEVKENARAALLALLTLKQRKSKEAAGLGFAPETCVGQPCLSMTAWPQRDGGDSLDGLLRALALQEAFQTWRTRWRESQLATMFSQVLVQRQLKGILGWWRWKTLSLNPLRIDSGPLAEDPLLVSPNSESSSLSSGFHSGGAALPTSGSSLGKESSLEESSRASVSSWATTEDLVLLPRRDSSSLEDLTDAALECHPRTPSALCSYHVGENPFQVARFLNLGTEAKPILASLMQKGAKSGDNTLEVQNRRRILARYFGLWSASSQNQKASRHRRRVLLSRTFRRWAAAAGSSSAWCEAPPKLEIARRQHILASCFGRWKAAFQRASQQRQNEESPTRNPEAGYRALRRWRKAARGTRALRLSSMNQAGSYWTRAAVFRQCGRQRSSLIGRQKFTKLFPAWPSRRRWNRGNDADTGFESQPSLTRSSFRVWLGTYRSQSRMRWVPETPEDLDGMGQRSKCARTLENSVEEDLAVEEGQQLGRKYLSLWRHRVLLCRFRAARETRSLVKAWVLWKDACRTELLVKALARQRLVERGWKTWRRRCLQSWVAENFLTTDNRRLLRKAFGKWKQLAAASRMEANYQFLAG